MLSLTRKTDYALLVLAAMARSGSDKTSVRDLAEQSGVSVRLLANILNRLKHEGLIKSARGTKGGYGLAMDPDQITLRRLIEAIEGPMRLARCCPVEGEVQSDGCRLEDSCITKEAVRKLHETLRNFLGQVTLRDLTWNTISLKVDLSVADDRYERLPAMVH
ncbi:MAG: Rrf2 family transcriptional regulator [Planctomycetes bacterium]|nr:Rrf2 family transcriptional regulator [Planctomycetota bacterium]